MPEIFREGPYVFRFYALDKGEPPHVHVRRDRSDVKFWLSRGDPPSVELAKDRGFPGHEVRKARKLVEKHRKQLLEEWHDYFDA
jgi:hypothetical protein